MNYSDTYRESFYWMLSGRQKMQPSSSGSMLPLFWRLYRPFREMRFLTTAKPQL